MPAVEIVDMRLEEGALSRRLIDAVRQVKREGGQSILFLNRRGFSYFWSCKSCGAELKCRHCSVGMTYHKERGRLVCHYCGYQTRAATGLPGLRLPRHRLGRLRHGAHRGGRGAALSRHEA